MATGCAAQDQATTVTLRRAMHLVEPTRSSALDVTDRNPATVRALLHDFCAIVAHPDKAKVILNCPNDIGLVYHGTFYAGNRTIATVDYGASGCQRVSLTTNGKAQNTIVAGPAATAAPNLENDMAAALGIPRSQVYAPAGGFNNGSPVTRLGLAR